MKNEFYQIPELNLNIKLKEISSYRLDCSIKGMKNPPKEILQCCIVVNPNSVYWCNQKHYYELNKIFFQ